MAWLQNPDTIFDCFIEPDEGSICITKLSIIRSSINLTYKLNQQLVTELNIGVGWQYHTSNEVNLLLNEKRGKRKYFLAT